MGLWSRTFLALAFAAVGSCEKDRAGTAPPDAAPSPMEEASVETQTQNAGPAGNANLHLALDPDETAGFCCDSGSPDSGTGCRREDRNLDACLRDGLYTFECTGRRVDCKNGSCQCGDETGDGIRLCCTSIEGSKAHQCTKWGESDYTACIDAGRQFAVCRGEKACKQSDKDDTRFECNCG